MIHQIHLRSINGAMSTGVIMVLVIIISATSIVRGDSQVQRNVAPIPDGRIVGGHDADIRDFPHQISMRYNGRHRCGGSIYTPTIIVSAAHCVMAVQVNNMTIVAGSTLLSEKYVEVQVVKIVRNPRYNPITHDYDVALLVLEEPLIYDEYIQPIALATERPPRGTEVIVTGWGTLVEGGSIPDHLQVVSVNVVDNEKCEESYRILLTDRMMCAAVDGGGKDACQGDSGGPLIVGQELLGIVSWGFGCARKRFPGVYASVPELHEWIVSTAEIWAPSADQKFVYY